MLQETQNTILTHTERCNVQAKYQFYKDKNAKFSNNNNNLKLSTKKL